MKTRMFFLFIVFLSGCDEVFDDTFYIQNSTGEEIKLICSISSVISTTQAGDTLFVLPNEKKFIVNVNSAGGKKQRRGSVKNVFSRFDAFHGVNESKYDYFDDNNWDYKSTSGNTAEYTMTIDSSHFD